MNIATQPATTTIQRSPATSGIAIVLPMGRGAAGRVDAGGTLLRVRALHVMGHGSTRIARAIGVREETIRRLVRGDTAIISPNLRDTITDLYDAWWDKSAPERTRAERAAATTARRRAAAGNWCAPAALNDDQLDTPGYRPRCHWRPATGTGTAPDIQPPTRLRRKKRTTRRTRL
jgi:hypothetical protein